MEPTTLRMPQAPSLAWPKHKAHLIGVCGAGMRALAELLLGMDWTVSGSDLQRPSSAVQHLARRGLTFHETHDQANVPADADCIVYSPAVPESNPERQAAAQLGIPQFSYTEMLGRLMQQRVGVCVAGTHGKSTTTAMTGCILSGAGLKPSVVIGAELCDTGRSAWSGSGSHLVVESCEFQRNFLAYHPQFAAILSVETDHVDCFATLAELQQAFADFAGQVSSDGLLLVHGDCPATMESVRQAAAEITTFGWSVELDWWAGDLRRTSNGTRFRVYRRGQYFSEISLSIPGRHNVLNALAAAALCHEIGVGPREIRDCLADFGGIRRRFEFVGQWRGVTIIDDYAHHPTAVAATLQTARELFGRRRIWCAFQPHQVSRTVALMSEFATSFADADQVLIAPAFAAREVVAAEPADVSTQLAGRIATLGQSAKFCESLDHLTAALEDGLEPGDVLITMGAGNIDCVHHAFTRRVSRNSAPRRAFGAVHLAETGWTRTVLPHSA
jgi:UDP-N-acetylmuramate--alanine ligase